MPDTQCPSSNPDLLCCYLSNSAASVAAAYWTPDSYVSTDGLHLQIWKSQLVEQGSSCVVVPDGVGTACAHLRDQSGQLSTCQVLLAISKHTYTHVRIHKVTPPALRDSERTVPLGRTILSQLSESTS